MSAEKIPAALLPFIVPIAELVAELVADRLGARPAPTPAAAPEWLPIKSCGLRATTARAAIKSGEIGASRVGRELVVNGADVVRYIESRRVRQHAADRGDELDRAMTRGRLRAVDGGRR